MLTWKTAMGHTTRASRLLAVIACALLLVGAFRWWRQITATESTRKAGNVVGYADNLCRDGDPWPASGETVGHAGYAIPCPFTGSVFVWDTVIEAGSVDCNTLIDTQPDRFFARSKDATIDGQRCFVFRDGGVILRDSEVDWQNHLRR